MKKDWTYKKFEDCIENVKYTTKIQSKDYMASGEYPIISQEEELVSGYWNKNKDVFSAPRPLVVFGDHTRVLKYIDFDFVLGADGVKILLPIEDLEAKFLYYFLKWYNVPNLGYSRHYKLLKEISIPIPPIAIQRSIVAELDLLHSVISKKQEQLRELDNLAQSLFYQMFGDPITNPMGWEIKKLGECFPYIKNGANIKQDRNAGGIPITRIETLSGGVFNRHKLGYADIFELGKYEHYVLSDGDLLLSHINSKIYIGRTVEYKKYGNEQIIHGMNLLCLKADKEILSSTYFAYFTHCEKFKNDIARIRKDAVNQSSISISDLKNFSLPLPPLSLQQSFAAKVSAIEAQKQAITQSIQHTEALLAQRMDQYFS